MRKALFAGSFDPVTLGHVDIVTRAAGLFDEIVVGVGTNSQKTGFFNLEQRMHMLHLAFSHLPKVTILPYDALTVEFATKIGAQYLIRGLRNGQDLEYEKPIALLNRHMEPSVETVYWVASPEVGHISSTLVREIVRYGRDCQGLVPEKVAQYMAEIRKKS